MTAGGEPGELLLEVDGIDVFYDDVQVLHGLSLEVRRGEIVPIRGSSLAGTSAALGENRGLRAARRGM